MDPAASESAKNNSINNHQIRRSHQRTICLTTILFLCIAAAWLLLWNTDYSWNFSDKNVCRIHKEETAKFLPEVEISFPKSKTATSWKQIVAKLLREATAAQITTIAPKQQRQNHPDSSSEKSAQKTRKIEVFFENAHSREPSLSKQQLEILAEFSQRVRASITDLHRRAADVGWGTGVRSTTTHQHAWWSIPHNNRGPIDQIDGGRLLWSYYRIMSDHMKYVHDLSANIYFPFKLCKEHGCSAETAIAHTLEWREKYQPWRVTPSVLRENEVGWVYHHGFSPAAPGEEHRHARHAVVYLRPGIHPAQDSAAYFRAILNTVDRAIGESLQSSHGRVGKFNVLIDAKGASLKTLPDFAHFKQAITMLQDHYPSRLGMLFLVNMSRTAEIIVHFVKPLITMEVRDKIHILSHDPEQRKAELESFIGTDSIPDWLGGSLVYRFNVHEYYPKKYYWSDLEGSNFAKTMPYHAIS
jgi:hypothetical protein